MVFRFDGMREGYLCLNSSHCMDMGQPIVYTLPGMIICKVILLGRSLWIMLHFMICPVVFIWLAKLRLFEL
jgi:hypothetical protein